MELRIKISQFLDGYPGGRGQFCKDAEISEGRLSQIMGGDLPSPKVAKAIHKITEGKIPGSLLRPDLWRQPADVPLETAAV